MNKLIILLVILSPYIVISQSLGKDRIEKLNNTVVQITIDSLDTTGTGFVISQEGIIATCFHVINPAFYRSKINNNVVGVRNIKAHFHNGKTIDLDVVPAFLIGDIFNGEYNNGLLGDYILLKPKDSTKTKYDFLKIGKWDEINDGDDIYTVGYPFSSNNRAITKGMFSTKFIDSLEFKPFKGKSYYKNRRAGWVDMTINKGNSGGPLIKIGNKQKDDIVVGIVSYNLNPNTKISKELSDLYKDIDKGKNNNSLTTNKVLAYILEVISKDSFGVNGVVPVEDIQSILSSLNQ